MADLKREKNFIKSTFILAFGTFLPKLASFVTLPIYTACLTKSQYGTFDLITILCTLFLPLATLQIQSAVYRFLLGTDDKEVNAKNIITTLYYFVVPVSVVALVILYFILYKLSVILRLLMLIYYFFDILLVVTRQVARGLHKNHIYSISAVVNSFLNMGLVVLFLPGFGWKLNGLVFSVTIATVVSFVYIFFALKTWQYIDKKQLSMKTFKSLISYSWPMVPNSISLWVMRVSDRAIISLFLDTAANGIYAAANKIPMLLQLAQNTFNMAWSESASMSVKDKDAGKYYSDMFKTLHRILAGFAAMLMAAQPLLFKILIRGDYGEAYIHISILVLGLFFSNIAVFIGGIYIANMRTKSIGVTTVIAAALNFLINIIFIRKIGIFAASLSTTISYLFLMIYRLIDVQKFQKLKFSVPEMIFTTAVLTGMCCMCWQRTFTFYMINLVVGTVFCFALNWSFIGSICRAVTRKLKRKK